MVSKFNLSHILISLSNKWPPNQWHLSPHPDKDMLSLNVFSPNIATQNRQIFTRGTIIDLDASFKLI